MLPAKRHRRKRASRTKRLGKMGKVRLMGRRKKRKTLMKVNGTTKRKLVKEKKAKRNPKVRVKMNKRLSGQRNEGNIKMGDNLYSLSSSCSIRSGF